MRVRRVFALGDGTVRARRVVVAAKAVDSTFEPLIKLYSR
jgi:hypothetical protein